MSCCFNIKTQNLQRSNISYLRAFLLFPDTSIFYMIQLTAHQNNDCSDMPNQNAGTLFSLNFASKFHIVMGFLGNDKIRVACRILSADYTTNHHQNKFRRWYTNQMKEIRISSRWSYLATKIGSNERNYIYVKFTLAKLLINLHLTTYYQVVLYARIRYVGKFMKCIAMYSQVPLLAQWIIYRIVNGL